MTRAFPHRFEARAEVARPAQPPKIPFPHAATLEKWADQADELQRAFGRWADTDCPDELTHAQSKAINTARDNLKMAAFNLYAAAVSFHQPPADPGSK